MTSDWPRGTRRWPWLVVVGAILLFLGIWWIRSSARARTDAWINAVRATGAKAGIERPDFDDIGEIIGQITHGDVIIVWTDHPDQTARILEIPDPPRWLMFMIAHPAEPGFLRTVKARFPNAGISHNPRMKWNDPHAIGWEDVR
ncbi:hypothetical protein Pan44_27160 [Caulifigura coniformis]|uniref:Uncharacterized protein n=1 Tax=Caulifigura coniformis TaxID=2527983 RepID=A0A517SEX6_9PLAN|nr:hypothetical protein [Caulifigura coniformis]QDT54681.1 hypothetical protein Pan44_27160 [Caulifigura coniformis]